MFQSAAHVADFLAQTQGNVLLATGAKELPAFAQLAPERLYPRVLPTLDGIAACEAAHIPHKNILALQGPFSYALNRALLEQFSIRFLVTKDGGGRRWLCRESAGCRRHRRPAHRDPPPGRDR